MAIAISPRGFPAATQNKYQSGTSGLGLVACTQALGAIPSGVTGLSVDEWMDGPFHRTRINLSAVPMSVLDTGGGLGSRSIYVFPAGTINVQGCVASLQQTTTSTLASTINASAAGYCGIGTTAATNIPIATTEVNILPATAITTSATINTPGTAVTAALAAPINLVSATALTAYLNHNLTTNTEIDADGTETWTGQVILTWMHCGDT